MLRRFARGVAKRDAGTRSVLNWPLRNETVGNELAFRALQLNSNIELVHGDAAALLHGEGNDVGARLYYTL